MNFDLQGNVGDILFQKDIGSLECCERPDGKVPVVRFLMDRWIGLIEDYVIHPDSSHSNFKQPMKL